MKTTIFVRILTATLLPVLLVVMIVIATAHNIIYQDGITNAKTYARFTAKQISDQTSLKLKDISTLQNHVSVEMAGIDFGASMAKYTLDKLLTALLLSDRNLYSVWFAFESEVFPEDGGYMKTLLRSGDGIREINTVRNEMLSDPNASSLYNVPFSTGQVYTKINDHNDYGMGDGFVHLFTMVYPIITSQGRVIGCVGLDIRYEDLFSINNFEEAEAQRIMLVSEEGNILFSTNKADIGNVLWDYGFQDANEVLRVLREQAVWQGELESLVMGERLLACMYPVDIAHAGQTVYLYRDVPVSGLYGSFYSSMQVIIVAGAMGMALLTFCVFTTTKGIARNVKRITESFYRVANDNAEDTLGGEHIPIYKTKVRELETLQDALVKMIIQLRRAHELKVGAVEAEVEREKLIAASEAKTNFFATMSHEIRTPMNAILGISEILLHEGNLAPSQEKYIQDIKISSDALLNIINDILDISKMETGKMELHPEHYNFKMLIDNIISLARQLTADANLQFAFEPVGEIPLCLYGDGARLRQVLLNLIGNAVKFTREGQVRLRVSMQEKTMRFDIADTGLGIKKSELGAIFDSFKRVDTRRNREIKGTGLGLAISKNLVELMDGTICVESVYGEGSTFSVTIPLVLGDEARLRQMKAQKGTRYLESLRILVVDDDRTNLNVSSGLLRAAHGIQCDTAISGPEAIKKVMETHYDIIFMDHMMPDMDGVDTTQRIRQMGGKYQRIPIIALTANAMLGTRKELMDGGMDDFLAKPIQSERLQEILDTWVPEDKRLPKSPKKNTKPTPAPEPVTQEISLSNLLLGSLLEKAGVDIVAGLEHIGFDEEMYLQSLRLFRESLPQTLHQLDTLLEVQDMRKFHVHAHGLKGSLANIGAAGFAEEARQLELAALESNVNQCLNLLAPLRATLQRLYDTLCETIPNEKDKTGKIPFNGGIFKSSLQQLNTALENYDYESITRELDVILSMKHTPETDEMLSQVKLLIESFDYTETIALLRGEILAAE